MTQATGVHAFQDSEGETVTTMVYDDGRVVQQKWFGADWIQIKDPDEWEPDPCEGDLEDGQGVGTDTR